MLNIFQFICTLICLKFAFRCLFYYPRTHSFIENALLNKTKRHQIQKWIFIKDLFSMNEILRHKMLRQKMYLLVRNFFNIKIITDILRILEHMKQKMNLYFICTIASEQKWRYWKYYFLYCKQRWWMSMIFLKVCASSKM